MAVPRQPPLCSLEAVVGKTRACPGDACPFWDPGGAVLGGRCAVESLGVMADPALATWLLEIREKLETASSEDEERAMRAVFHHLLNGSE